jgi:hypothetical protein
MHANVPFETSMEKKFLIGWNNNILKYTLYECLLMMLITLNELRYKAQDFKKIYTNLQPPQKTEFSN